MADAKANKRNPDTVLSVNRHSAGTTLAVFFLAALLLSTAIALPIALRQTSIRINAASEKALSRTDEVFDSYEHSFLQFELLIQQEMNKTKAPDDLEAYLKSIDDTLLNIEGESYDGVYLYYEGRYIYSWDTPYSVYEESGYDATARPWYIGAVKANGNVFVTDPYMSYANNYMLATISRLQPDGETVIAYDIKMPGLQDCISGFNAINGVEAFVHDASGNLICASNALYLGENLFLSEEQLRSNVADDEVRFSESEGTEDEEKAARALQASQAALDFVQKDGDLLSSCYAHPQSLQFNWGTRHLGYLSQSEGYSCFVILPLYSFVLAEFTIWIILLLLILGLELIISVEVLRRKNIQAMRANRSALEEALVAADSANAAKSQFLSRMSHDMRTPLNAILGFTTLAEDEPEESPEIKGYLQKIDESGHYLLGLINDVLDMSKIEDGKLELHPEPYHYTDFRDTMCTIMEPKARERGVDFVMKCDITAPETVMVDKLRIQQIFMNLLNNAIKFTPHGGRVEFLVVGDDITSDSRMPLTFTVKDTGIGMSEDFIKNKLFCPFEQERRVSVQADAGTGLGLSIAKKLVEHLGGTIECESKLGSGTTFTVCICPKIGGNSPDITAKKEISHDCLKGARILLCEDNYLNTVIAVKLLEKVGCLIDTAENGKQGVELFKASAPGAYAAILMDIRMPEMDGLEATEMIRALKREDAPAIPIIAMSANAFAEDVQVSLSVGMSAHLSKPIDPAKLFDTLAEQLKKKK